MPNFFFNLGISVVGFSFIKTDNIELIFCLRYNCARKFRFLKKGIRKKLLQLNNGQYEFGL